jgi:Double-GTPase 1
MTPPTSRRTTLLVVGEYGVGKTHYGAQLLQRLNQQGGALRMRGAASNISAYESALQRLNEGIAAEHTARSEYVESLWPVEDRGGQATDLVWPDYGGEQVQQMIVQRQVSPAWRERLRLSNGWLLFVRVQHSQVDDDMFSRPLAQLAQIQDTERTFKMSEQAHYVELLQMLLFVRGVGTLLQVAAPALTVLLSCWDEVGPAGDGVRPSDMLAQRLPMLADFVTANWRSERLSVVGLSALGRPLRTDVPDEDYINRGPEQFGYVVSADGSHADDLTLPIADLARLAGA